MSDVFISYSRKDLERVRGLIAALEANALSVWWDRKLRIGSSFREDIDQALHGARVVIVVWSANSIKSNWVREEADEGARRGILIPVLLDDVMIPIGFRSLQAGDFTHWQGDPSDAALQNLLHGIGAVLNRGAPAPDDPARGAPPPASSQQAGAPRPGQRVVPAPSSRLPGPKLAALSAGALILVAGTAFLLVGNRSGRPDTPGPAATAAKPAVPGRPASAATPAAPELPPLLVAEPPPAEYFVLPALGPQASSSLRLAVLSEKTNGITDHADWWVANGLSSLTYTAPNPFKNEVGDLPSFVPKDFKGMRVVKVLRGNPVMAIYGQNFSEGRYLLGIDPPSGRVLFSFDFLLYEWPKSFDRKEKEFIKMATEWAHAENNTLFVSHAHSTYAKSSNGYNAYITAIDIQSNRILWRSQALVSNASNFVVKRDAIITGYGFTAEKRFLYVLNKADGRIVQQLPLKNYPEYLVEKGERLYLRTYNVDYVLGYK